MNGVYYTPVLCLPVKGSQDFLMDAFTFSSLYGFVLFFSDFKDTQKLWGTDELVSQPFFNGHINTITEKWIKMLRYLTFTTVGRINLKKQNLHWEKNSCL